MKDLFFKEFSARVAEVVSSGMGDGYDVSAWINAVVKDCEFVMHALEGDSSELMRDVLVWIFGWMGIFGFGCGIDPDEDEPVITWEDVSVAVKKLKELAEDTQWPESSAEWLRMLADRLERVIG
ncbi:MAG: hypothetical protein IJM68_01085 [Synergistaceae bacterium]|nr:hypothetical protein [Synergistaceae bacterium]